MPTPKARNRVRAIETDEVSIVDRAANARKFLVYKNDGTLDESATAAKLLEAVEEAPAAESAEAVTQALAVMGIAEAIVEGGPELTAAVKALTLADPEYSSTVLAACDAANMIESDKSNVRYALRMLGGQLKQMPVEVVRALARLAGVDFSSETSKESDTMPKLKVVKNAEGKIDLAATLADVPAEERAGIEIVLKAQRDELEATLAEERTRADKAEGKATELTERVEGLSRDVSAERMARRTREFTEKAATYAFLPGSVEERAKLLLDVHDVNKELGERVEAAFKAADDAIRASAAFKEHGGRGQARKSAEGAEAKIRQLAGERVNTAKAAGKVLPLHQAIREVITEQPELYEQQLEESAAGR